MQQRFVLPILGENILKAFKRNLILSTRYTFYIQNGVKNEFFFAHLWQDLLSQKLLHCQPKLRNIT